MKLARMGRAFVSAGTWDVLIVEIVRALLLCEELKRAAGPRVDASRTTGQCHGR